MATPYNTLSKSIKFCIVLTSPRFIFNFRPKRVQLRFCQERKRRQTRLRKIISCWFFAWTSQIIHWECPQSFIAFRQALGLFWISDGTRAIAFCHKRKRSQTRLRKLISCWFFAWTSQITHWECTQHFVAFRQALSLFWISDGTRAISFFPKTEAEANAP